VVQHLNIRQPKERKSRQVTNNRATISSLESYDNTATVQLSRQARKEERDNDGPILSSLWNKGYHNEISHLPEFENCEMKDGRKGFGSEGQETENLLETVSIYRVHDGFRHGLHPGCLMRHEPFGKHLLITQPKVVLFCAFETDWRRSQHGWQGFDEGIEKPKTVLGTVSTTVSDAFRHGLHRASLIRHEPFVS
jgi:hypothetical protein